MEGTETPAPALDDARAAIAGGAWARAYELFVAAAAERRLEAADLERFAKAAYWIGDASTSVSIRESAYQAFVESDDNVGAALSALTLQRQHLSMLQDSLAAAWLTRAERLLSQTPESIANGYLAIAHADAARARGDLTEAQALVVRAVEIGSRSDDRDLPTWALMRRGMLLVDAGRVEQGWPLLEEIAGAAAGGELGTFTTGAALSNAVSVLCDLGDYRHASEWSDATMRWCERRQIVGFPGICRVHRATVLRMLGRLQEAEAEARAAWTELRDFSPAHAAAAQHELGEVLLRMGELTAADEAFRQARELSEDPQPGLALLRLRQGQPEAAAATIARSLQVAAFDRFARTRMLPAQAEVALATGDAQTARIAGDELAEIAEQVGTPAIRAASAWTAGIAALLEGDPGRASGHLTDARRRWEEVGTPYESGKTRLVLAEAQVSGGNEEAAAVELEAARTVFERIGALLEARRAAELRARIAHGAASRQVRTFLFTDIVGSTALIEAIGDEAWNDLRRWHNDALRSSFADHRGEEVDHAGDGFFVAFPDAASALACAIDIQRRLAAHRQTHGFAPRVRMGLHAAAATQDGSGYTGLGVHTASRIGALAGGDEILASAETVADLAGVTTSARRRVTLKGIVEPVDVVELDWRSAQRD